MALNNPPQEALESHVDISRSPEEPDSESEEQEDEQQLEKLELEVKQIAKKVLECRTTLPDQLKATFASLLSAQLPILPDIDIDSVSDPGPSGDSNQNPSGSGEQVKTSKTALLTEENQKIAEKVLLLKDKISSNVTAMPIVLKRMKECMSKIDKLDSYNGIIHPAFKKTKAS